MFVLPFPSSLAGWANDFLVTATGTTGFIVNLAVTVTNRTPHCLDTVTRFAVSHFSLLDLKLFYLNHILLCTNSVAFLNTSFFSSWDSPLILFSMNVWAGGLVME